MSTHATVMDLHQLPEGPFVPIQTPFETTVKILYRSVTKLEATMKEPVQPSILPPEVYDSLKLHVQALGEGDPSTACCQEREEWQTRIAVHRRHASTIRQLLRLLVSNRHTCANFLVISEKYNLTSRLWGLSFHANLDALRRASFCSTIAFELLMDCLAEAFTFYTELLRDAILSPFQVAWFEALGDLGRYNLAVLAMLAEGVGRAVLFARGRNLDAEAAKWKVTADNWYSKALELDPGSGKLQHHLGLLFRFDEAQTLRSLYHFTTSMIALRPFQESHHSVLAIWAPFSQEQRRRNLKGAWGRATEAFVLLHGMIFQSDSLDDFSAILTCCLGRLEKESVEESEWAMMAAVNVSCVLDYGRSGRISVDEIRLPSLTSGQLDTRLDVAESRRQCPLSCSIQLTCSMLAVAIRRQLSSSPSCSKVNPYIIVTLTFLCALTRCPDAMPAFHSHIPWTELQLLNTASPEGLPSVRLCRLLQAITPIEDSYTRGMGWVGSPESHLTDEDWDIQRTELDNAPSSDVMGWARALTAIDHLNRLRGNVVKQGTPSVEGTTLVGQRHATSKSTVNSNAFRRDSTTSRFKPPVAIRRGDGSMHKI